MRPCSAASVEGQKGPRLYDWVRAPLFRMAGLEWEHWLLVQRSLQHPTATAYYAVFRLCPGGHLAERAGASGGV